MSSKPTSDQSGAKSSQMTQSDAARIQSSQARGGGDMTSSGFAARAQSAGDRNTNSGTSGPTEGSSK
ncbi:hypothetical protein ACEQ8H_008421 [Pleosporales sp. CAS-2024a]